MSTSPSPAFFAIVSRHFATNILGTLSRPALHVYAYLRSWCTGPAGAASGWVELRVRWIAHQLGRTDRHVRRGLAELRAARLIEAEERFVLQDDGTRAQVANRWRVLPEPGFPIAVAPAGDASASTDPDTDAQVVAAIEAEVDPVVASVHEWAATAWEEATTRAAEVAATVTAIEAGTLDAADARVWGEPGTARAAASVAGLMEARLDAEQDAATAAEALSLSPAEAAILPRWEGDVVSTIAHRVVRRLMADGMRKRKAETAVSRAIIETVRAKCRGGVDAQRHTDYTWPQE